MRTNVIARGDRLFDSTGHYFGQVRSRLSFHGDIVQVSMASPWEAFRPDVKPEITVNCMTISKTEIPGVWVVHHNMDLNDRRLRERVEFTLHDQFSLTV